MSDDEAFVQLPPAAPKDLAAAIQAAVTDDPDFAAKLRAGATQSVADTPADDATARAFQTLLEVGYLVASADGFAESERESLAALLATVTGSAVDPGTLTLHFMDLDEAVEQLGRRERLARVAADLETSDAVDQAVRLGALVAMADGCLSHSELTVLIELGERTKLSGERIREIVRAAAEGVKGRLA
jgi:tellurite resistance protein